MATLGEMLPALRWKNRVRSRGNGAGPVMGAQKPRVQAAGAGKRDTTAVPVRGRPERPQLGHEPRPGGLSLDEEVVRALERHEAGARDAAGEPSPLTERNQPVVAGVEHERGHADPREERGNVEVANRVAEPVGVLGDAVLRCTSLNAAISSALAPGKRAT